MTPTSFTECLDAYDVVLLVGNQPALTLTAKDAIKTTPGRATIPPPGIKISDADRAELTSSALEFEKEIQSVRKELNGQQRLLELLPDVLIYHKAVDWALKYDEFYEAREVKTARELLKTGRERLAQLKARKPEWINETGLVVRGYTSKIDGSVQTPYGLVVPESYSPRRSSALMSGVMAEARS